MNQHNRFNPFPSRILERALLTGSGSTKKTYHLALDLAGSGIVYSPGDSIAILPENDPAEVDAFLGAIERTGDEFIFDPRSQTEFSLRDYLLCKANLHKPSPAFLRKLSAPPAEDKTVSELVSDAAFSYKELPSLLLPLLPRFYSIASSQHLFPNEVHLTVASVSYTAGGKIRHGVGTHFLCDRAAIGATKIPLYIQPSHGFALPADPNASIILVGPGTGVAPYRAFLQERLYKQTTGRNWLFFGERHRKHDFYYADFWLALEKEKRLRLDLAFSRDGNEKVYVQHKMWENRRDLFTWIEEGAYFYVCGDAKEMAKDVEAMLVKIFASEGNLPEEEVRRKLKALRVEKRYLADVY